MQPPRPPRIVGRPYVAVLIAALGLIATWVGLVNL
jgi:hypothetical protein